MKLNPQIIEETQREAIINRPHNLAGSIMRVVKERFTITPNSIELKETRVVPAVIKLFQEALDNPIDVAIKTDYQYGNKVEITVTKDTITVKDNGYGISSVVGEDGEYPLYKATCKYNTSSNYKTENEGQKGVNGIGIKLSNTLATKFYAESCDGIKMVMLESTENNLHHKIKEKPCKDKGTMISFKPDFKIFEIDELDEEHINRMFEYTLMQALTYPEIDFKFNGKKVSYTPKKFLELFGVEFELIQSEDYFVAIMPNATDDFRQLSFVNGLETQRGGTHVDYIANNVISGIRSKLLKKYPSIKPGDIKNKLQIVIIARKFKGLNWDGQTKESVTNPIKDMSDYFSAIDFEKVVNKLMKNDSIINPITEVYKIKEELKRRQELKGLDKPVKKIKSEKYLPAIKHKKYLLLCEGASAVGGLSPVLGRNECGYYELKGKPMNAWSQPQSKFTSNTELSELYKIVQQEGYEYIVVASDQDLDGIHIRGLLSGFVEKYLPDSKDKFCFLQTPIVALKKAGKTVKWFYDLDEYNAFDIKGYESKYFKGLGSWTEKDLKLIVEQDGLSKMIQQIDFDSTEMMDDWLGDKNADKRKEYIQANNFSIALV